jgi:hypothetical protein
LLCVQLHNLKKPCGIGTFDNFLSRTQVFYGPGRTRDSFEMVPRQYTKNLGGKWNDQIKAASVGEGSKVTLFEHHELGGRVLQLKPGTYNLADAKTGTCLRSECTQFYQGHCIKYECVQYETWDMIVSSITVAPL